MSDDAYYDAPDKIRAPAECHRCRRLRMAVFSKRRGKLGVDAEWLVEIERDGVNYTARRECKACKEKRACMNLDIALETRKAAWRKAEDVAQRQHAKLSKEKP